MVVHSYDPSYSGHSEATEYIRRPYLNESISKTSLICQVSHEAGAYCLCCSDSKVKFAELIDE